MKSTMLCFNYSIAMMPPKYTPIQKVFSCLCNERKFNYPCDCADLAVRVSGTIIQCRHTAHNNKMMQGV